MRKKLLIFFIFWIIFLVGVIILFKTKIIQFEIDTEENSINTNETNKLTPEEEISDKQLRTSKVKIYFGDKEGVLSAETRDIDVKDLLQDPYKIIINLLIEGPKEENEKLIPEGTKLIGTERIGDVLVINFSKEFIENSDKDKNKQELLIKSIVYSVMELREINAIKIQIEGEEVKSFKENGYDLSGEISFE